MWSEVQGEMWSEAQGEMWSEAWGGRRSGRRCGAERGEVGWEEAKMACEITSDAIQQYSIYNQKDVLIIELIINLFFISFFISTSPRYFTSLTQRTVPWVFPGEMEKRPPANITSPRPFESETLPDL